MGCGGALNHLRRDWPSAPRQARCEMSGPRSENDSFPLHRGRGIPPTVSTKRAASRRGGARPVGRQGRIDVPSINPRRAVAGLSSHRVLCVCGCENLCACVSVSAVCDCACVVLGAPVCSTTSLALPLTDWRPLTGLGEQNRTGEWRSRAPSLLPPDWLGVQARDC